MSLFPFGATRRAFVFAAPLAAALLATTSAWAAQVLHRGNGAEPESLDPHITTGVPEAHLQRDLFEGLVAEAADGKIGPGTAERWDISADGLIYTFHLRANAKWSNGEPVTARTSSIRSAACSIRRPRPNTPSCSGR